jgi:nitrite reductase (NADH) small subunit
MSVDVGAASDFPDGSASEVFAGSRKLALVRWGERFYALRSACPHQAASLCEGSVLARLVGQGVGSVGIDTDAPVLVCPWHSWEFDVRTGRSVTQGDRFRVATYPVATLDGRVLIDLDPVRGAPRSG